MRKYHEMRWIANLRINSKSFKIIQISNGLDPFSIYLIFSFRDILVCIHCVFSPSLTLIDSQRTVSGQWPSGNLEAERLDIYLHRSIGVNLYPQIMAISHDV